MILVDSSVWIDYFKGTITAPRHLDTPAVSLPRLVTTWLRSRQTGDVVPSGDWPGCAWITGHSERCLLAVRGATTPIPCTREMIEREMKTADFKGELTPNGHIAVPPDIAALVPPGEQIQVVPQSGSSEDDAAWRAAGRRRFEAGYAADDSIYESLIHDASTRVKSS